MKRFKENELKRFIEVIESCSTYPEAARKLGIGSRQAIVQRLERYGYRVVQDKKLRVVKENQ